VSLSGEKVVAQRVLNVTDYFNPIDCRSLGVIRTTLAEMQRGEVLQVLGNRFQQREISAWTKKFAHKIVRIEDEDGLVKIYIEKGGRA
jgi:TusA-related sulfurtransferase